jgi:hypothetical protein
MSFAAEFHRPLSKRECVCCEAEDLSEAANDILRSDPEDLSEAANDILRSDPQILMCFQVPPRNFQLITVAINTM